MFTPKPTAGPRGLLLVSRCESDQGALRGERNFVYTDHLQAIPTPQGPHLGRLRSAPVKRTCRTVNIGMEHAAVLFRRSKTKGPVGSCRGFSMCGPQEPWLRFQDPSEINYLVLLLARMSRTVNVSDHAASTFWQFRHSVRIRAPRIAGLPDMRGAQVNCAILCREDGVIFEIRGG